MLGSTPKVTRARPCPVLTGQTPIPQMAQGSPAGAAAMQDSNSTNQRATLLALFDVAVAAERHYLERGQAERISGFVTTRYGYALPTEILEVTEAGHPVPDANSIRSAARALNLAKSAGSD